MQHDPLKNTQNVIVGIDVSKDNLDTYINSTNDWFKFPNTPEGIEKLVAMLAEIEPALVIFEATGNYEHDMMMAVGKAGIPFHRVNPRWTHSYARSRGILAKTDKLDAKILAEFAAERSPKPHKIPNDREVELDEMLRWQRQLTAQAAKLKTQIQQAKSGFVLEDIKSLLATCREKLDAVNAAIDELIQADPESRQRDEILQSVPGVGPQTSRALNIELRELGKFSAAQIASTTGLAPMNDDTGRHRGLRRIQGGRPFPRTALYQAAVVAATRTNSRNAPLRALYIRLRAAGKPFKVAVIACARKLLVILNAMIRTKTKWQQTS